MAKVSFVLIAERGDMYLYLKFLNKKQAISLCYNAWFRKTKISIKKRKSKNIRFTLEEMNDANANTNSSL